MCRSASAVVVAAIALAEAAFGTDSILSDAEIVVFESTSCTYPPSPLKLEQVRKPGIPVEVKIEPGVPLAGYLDKPSGEQPRAAIVLLHTCAGISEQEEIWSITLRREPSPDRMDYCRCGKVRNLPDDAPSRVDASPYRRFRSAAGPGDMHTVLRND